MIIALSASGSEKEFVLDTRLGRCPTYAFYNDEKDIWSFMPNPGAVQDSGAGIKAAQFLIEQNTDVLLTGEMGPKAARILNSTKIKVYSLSEVPLKEAIKLYQEGRCKIISEATVNSHTGINSPRDNLE